MTELGKKIAVSAASLVVVIVSSATCAEPPSRITATTPTATVVESEIQVALDNLHPGCREVDAELQSATAHALKLLQRNGIDDETQLTLLEHLRQSTTAAFGSLDVSCAQQLGTLVALRMLREGK